MFLSRLLRYGPKKVAAIVTLLLSPLILLLLDLGILDPFENPPVAFVPVPENEPGLLTELSRFTSSEGAEIAAYDADTAKVFVIGGSDQLEVVSIADPAAPLGLGFVDLSGYGDGANSVSVHDGVVAVAVERETDSNQEPGVVVFLDADSLAELAVVTVGFLPDMLTFSPNGRCVVVACEGEPNDDYTFDPPGSISIIDTSGPIAGLTDVDVTDLGFEAWNEGGSKQLDPNVRVFGGPDDNKSSVAQDLEPEYAAITPDSRTAFVAMQENNGFAVVDLRRKKIKKIIGFGTKDGRLPGDEFDVSNKDDVHQLRSWPVCWMYQPDAIATTRIKGQTLIFSANEGDARDYDGWSEEVRVEDLTLDPVIDALWAADLQEEEELGRLKTTTETGDLDGDGDIDQIHGYGARSFTIWNKHGKVVYDSGNQISNITEAAGTFNEDEGELDGRSDDKGAEPEALTLGELDGRHLVFVGLERSNGVCVWDVSDPKAPVFLQYEVNSDDIGPEGLVFISRDDSPNPGQALLLVASEESNTLTVYGVGADTDLAPFGID